MSSPQRSLSIIARGLILLGLIAFVFVLIGWAPSGAGLFLPLASFILLAVGFILLKKPEYIGFAVT
ncbi:MAG TPA: hypothetical protein VHN82_07440 [Methanoregula sp.]|nr:hypothetical protein [Methanoregula sp.]